MLCSRLVFSEYLRQVLQAGRSVLGLLSAVGEWLINIYATAIHVFDAPHSNYSAQPFMTIVLLSLQLFTV